MMTDVMTMSEDNSITSSRAHGAGLMPAAARLGVCRFESGCGSYVPTLDNVRTMSRMQEPGRRKSDDDVQDHLFNCGCSPKNRYIVSVTQFAVPLQLTRLPMLRRHLTRNARLFG